MHKTKNGSIDVSAHNSNGCESCYSCSCNTNEKDNDRSICASYELPIYEMIMDRIKLEFTQLGVDIFSANDVSIAANVELLLVISNVLVCNSNTTLIKIILLQHWIMRMMSNLSIWQLNIFQLASNYCMSQIN